ncbi:MAG: hypothetical protein RMM17_13655 [Acidobacteriota bacterium]|nr:hypothetical protein [Blastocatellia bacterium]MDW8413713.1 hypothetical protein [Acidobacteriota bacterium]
MRCKFCFPPQELIQTGPIAFCPLCERIYTSSKAAEEAEVSSTPVDFFPSRNKARGDELPMTINPAEDRFGRPESFTQRRIMPDRSIKTWQVDIELIKELFSHYKWLRNENLLKRDLEEMQQHLPNWILTFGEDDPYEKYEKSSILSPCCKDNLVPTRGAVRCIFCDKPYKVKRPTYLGWSGLLPVNLSDRPKVLEVLQKAIEDRKLSYPIIDILGAKHILIPIEVYYPRDWPHNQPTAYYGSFEFVDLLEAAGHTAHLIGETQICLYASKEWNESITILQVVANRIAPHTFALVKYAEDKQVPKYFR